MRAQRDADQIWSFNAHICDMGPFLVFLVKFLSGLIIEPNERNEGSDQTVRMRSLIRVFAVRKQNHWIPQNVSMERKCPDSTLCMCRMM